MIKTVLRLAIVGLIGYALYQFVPLYINYQQFKDDIKQIALFAGSASEAEVVERVMASAQLREVPVTRENIEVTRRETQTLINARYTQPVKVLPWYTYVWQIDIAMTGWRVLPRGGN